MNLRNQTPQQAGKELLHAVRQATNGQGGMMVSTAITRLDIFLSTTVKALDGLQQEVAKLREEVAQLKASR